LDYINERADASSSEKSSKKSKKPDISTKKIISKGILTDVTHSWQGEVKKRQEVLISKLYNTYVKELNIREHSMYLRSSIFSYETFKEIFISKNFDVSRNNFISRRQLNFKIATVDVGKSEAARQSLYFLARRQETLKSRITIRHHKHLALRKYHLNGTGFKVLLRPSLDEATVIDDEGNITEENFAMEEECNILNISAIELRKVSVQCLVVSTLYFSLNQRDKEEFQMIESLFEKISSDNSLPNESAHELIKDHYRILKEFRKFNNMFNICCQVLISVDMMKVGHRRSMNRSDLSKSSAAGGSMGGADPHGGEISEFRKRLNLKCILEHIGC